MNSPLLLPMFAHVAWTVSLYVLLTIMRAPAIWGNGSSKSYAALLKVLEPRTSANLSNQFEWPLFFYVACVLLITSEPILVDAYVLLAWIFVVGRMVHSGVQIFTSNVRLRGAVFTINFVAVLNMWWIIVSNYMNNAGGAQS